MAIFGWLSNLTRVYGAPLVVLVGLGYWIQGFRCFPWMAMGFYFKDVLKLDPGSLQFVQSTVNLPMVAKPIYGIFSDVVYIRGAHRLPYLILGGLLQILSWGAVVLLPGVGSSVAVLAAVLALGNLGASISEVANDALVAEYSKSGKSAGELQSFAWFSSAGGGVIGNLLGGMALSQIEFKTMFTIFVSLLIVQVVKYVQVNEGSLGFRDAISGETDKKERAADSSIPLKRKPKHASVRRGSNKPTDLQRIDKQENDCWQSSTPKIEMVPEEKANSITMFQQLADIIQVVKQPKFLYPMAWFAASYAMIPTLSGTIFFYQTQYLKMDPLIVGLAKVVGQVGLMVGSVVYSRFLKNISLRKLLGSTQVFISFCMLSDIFLVKGINVQLGIPNEVMVLGGSAFVDAIGQFKILPFMVFLTQICPSGSEGSVLAVLMSIQCLASIVSGYLGVVLTSFLHISSDSLAELPVGIVIQALAALVPLLCISFIPKDLEMPALQQRDGKHT